LAAAVAPPDLDVKIECEYLFLFIRKSKTDQYRNGNEVLIAKGETIAAYYKVLKASQLKQDLFSVSMDEQPSWLILAKTLYKNC
jgi:hypothetical protein